MNQRQRESYVNVVKAIRQRQHIYSVRLYDGDMPKVYQLKPPTIMGSHSLTQLRDKVRHMDTKGCTALSIVDEYGALSGTIYETNGSIARDYLKVTFKRAPKMTSEQWNVAREPVAVPLFAKPTHFKNGYYVDIRSAWWSILRVVGWNVDYWPNNWIASGTLPLDFPFHGNKVARSALVSVALGNTIRVARCTAERHDAPNHICTIGEIAEERKFSEHYHPMLFRLVCDVLHGMALDALDVGAVYVNNDGWIAPSEPIARRLLQVADEWGLAATVKHNGAGMVFGVGSYIIGGKKTSRLIRPSPLDGVRRLSYRRWLKYSFRRLAERSERIWSDEMPEVQ